MNNNFELAEVLEKERRVREFLEKSGKDAVVIGRQDNFAWFTGGGTNKVVITSEAGFAYLIITKYKVYIVAQVMDGPRILDEEIPGYPVEAVFLTWCEGSLEDKIVQLTRGMKVISDTRMPGVEFAPSEIYKLHYPFTDREIEKCRYIGRKTDEILRKAADAIKPGMVDYEIEAMLLYEYAKLDAIPEVILVGIDERIGKYRHCIPAGKKVGKTLVIHPALRMGGLHANVARMIHFGDDLPQDIMKRHEAANSIMATALSMCVPGRKFVDIHKELECRFAAFGYEEEWKKHFIGGITGYMLADDSVCFNPEAEVSINQVYDWFVTITGVKVEELGLCSSKGREFVSVTGRWPAKEYEAAGQIFKLPQILIK